MYARSEDSLTIKDFDLLNVIGRGSYGKVILARHQENGRVLAVKVQNKEKLRTQSRLVHARNEQEILVSVTQVTLAEQGQASLHC